MVAHGAWLLRLNAILNAALPSGFQGAVRLANVKADRAILLVENGAMAAKLRQMSLRLQATLRTAGVECTGVEIKVQPQETQLKSRDSVAKPLSGTSCQTLLGFAETLPEGDVLRAALERLVRQAARVD